MTYTSALIVDLLSQRTCEFLFEKNADIINGTNSGPYFYYAYFEQEGKVSFHQFKFLNFSDKEFMILKRHSTSSLGDVRLLGLDDRHVFVFDPGPQPDISCFYQFKLLVDALNGQTHPVPDRLGNDFFSRLQDAWLLDGGKFLTVKTGRIQWWEKKEFWQQNVTHYTDRIETLALCRTDDLIRCIQAGQDIPWTIIDQSDCSSALRMLGIMINVFIILNKIFKAVARRFINIPCILLLIVPIFCISLKVNSNKCFSTLTKDMVFDGRTKSEMNSNWFV